MYCDQCCFVVLMAWAFEHHDFLPKIFKILCYLVYDLKFSGFTEKYEDLEDEKTKGLKQNLPVSDCTKKSSKIYNLWYTI